MRSEIWLTGLVMNVRVKWVSPFLHLCGSVTRDDSSVHTYHLFAFVAFALKPSVQACKIEQFLTPARLIRITV